MPRPPASDYRTSTEHANCPICGVRGEAAAFFHSAQGLVCEVCHHRARAEERARNAAREGGVDAMLNGLLSLAAGLATSVFVTLLPEGPLPTRSISLFLFGVAVAVAARVRAGRFVESAPRGRMWRTVATFGAALAVCALVAFLGRMVLSRG
ncbi:MAG: hypothetical protein QM820_15800 [Minicystis sp.]